MSTVFSTPKPGRFLDALERHPALDPPLTALCANYEEGEWRYRQLALHLIKWLPEFALKWSDRDTFDSATGVTQLARAARLVYATDYYDRRGEFGELLLHAVMRHEFNTEPAIAKLFFKDARNDTVKWFDAVHVVATEDGELELWLGEVKFYSDISDAMSAVASELKEHTDRNYLKDEFALITNKLDPAWPLTGKLQRALDYENVPLDQIFDRVRIPVLLIRANAGLDPMQQVDAALELHERTDHYRRWLTWRGAPSYDQLQETCGFIWSHLGGHTLRGNGAYSDRQLTYKVTQLRGHTIRWIVDDDLAKNPEHEPDKVVEEALGFVRQWAGHHFPRRLAALDRIQQHVFSQQGIAPGDYSFYVGQVENLFLPGPMIALDEYGVPLALAVKLRHQLMPTSDADLDAVLDRLRALDAGTLDLSRFEKDLIEDTKRTL